MAETYDAIVLGGGAWGSAAAQHIATRGHRVLCIDRFTPPHAHGSTHGRSRLINSNAESSSNNAPLIARSYELWRRLERESGRPLMEVVGYLFVGSPTSPRMLKNLASAGAPHEVLTAVEIRRRFPQFRLESDEVGIFDPEAARLDPEECVTAALEIAGRHGAELRFGEAVIDWTAPEGGVEVITAAGHFAASHLVIAAGAWTPSLAKVALPLWVERQFTAWYAHGEHKLGGFSFPAEPTATSLYGVPEGGGKIKVAFHHGGKPTDPDEVAAVTDGELAALRDLLAERVPVLRDVVGFATCIYTNTPDLQYALGPHPDHDQVTILAGGSGRGFHQSQVIGEYAADRVEGKRRADLDWLSLRRFAD